MAKKSNYREGDWFAVPLDDGGYAIGVAARANPKDGVLLGYFFGPRREEVPSLRDMQNLHAADAVLVGHFGHLGLTQGKWPNIGAFDDWDRTAWPMPVFVRYEQLSGRSFKVYYDDDDPNKRVKEEQIRPGTAEHGPTAGLMGAGYVEEVLSDALR